METKEKVKRQKKVLNWFFVIALGLMDACLLSLGVVSFLDFLKGDINIYGFVAVSIMLVWLCIIIGYIAWAIYFYNINMGLTNEDWAEIKEKKKNLEADILLGDATKADSGEPQYNPYLNQTFGLPPGTIRGTIALTLLVGAISMLIFAMGMKDTLDEHSLLRENFEFFKTAFLMMIAFYFGTKSLDVLKDRWGKRVIGGPPQPVGDTTDEDKEKEEAGSNMNNTDITTEPDVTKEVAKSTISNIKNILKTDDEADEPEKTEEKDKQINKEHPTVIDLETNKTLSDEDINEAAKSLDIEPAIIKAVIKVESAGNGFLKDGNPKILFEGHIFYKELEKRNIDPVPLTVSHPDIVYKNWTRQYYKGGAGEYERLEKAKLINNEAAISSASWGLFQIMGFNYKLAGFKDVSTYVEKQYISEEEHLKAFISYLKSRKLINFLKNKDWAGFAYRYNGKGYKKNKYDTKLQAAYEKYSSLT